MTKIKEKFTVYIDDFFHSPDVDGEYRITDREYNTNKKAVCRCREIVEGFIINTYEPGMTDGDMIRKNYFYGVDPFVSPTPKGEHFSARDYASKRIAEITKSTK